MKKTEIIMNDLEREIRSADEDILRGADRLIRYCNDIKAAVQNELQTSGSISGGSFMASAADDLEAMLRRRRVAHDNKIMVTRVLGFMKDES